MGCSTSKNSERKFSPPGREMTAWEVSDFEKDIAKRFGTC